MVAVDRALADADVPVALVGYASAIRELTGVVDVRDVEILDDRYWLYVAPDRDRLSALGFRFAEP
ncbi:MAG: hypothetical protein R2712_01570 [Vicinamibacterales bacterium]